MLLLYENPSIRQFVANDAFQTLKYQSQAGCRKKLGSIIHHENFVPKTLLDFLMKYT